MANKTRNWRPSEGYYQTIREALTEEQKSWNDQEMVDYICGQWLARCESHTDDTLSQSESHSTNEVMQSESLTKLNERIELIAESKTKDWSKDIREMQEDIQELNTNVKRITPSSNSDGVSREEYIDSIQSMKNKISGLEDIVEGLLNR